MALTRIDGSQVTGNLTGVLTLTANNGVYTNNLYYANGNPWPISGTSTANSNTVSVYATSNGASITPTSNVTQYEVTALAVSGTVTFNAPVGIPVDAQKLIIRIKDAGVAQTLSWITSAGGYRIIGTTLPTATVANKTTYVGCIYNSADSFWDVVAVTTQA